MGLITKAVKKATKKVALMDSLGDLKKDLQKLGDIPRGKDIYDYGVKFFNIIASFQDNNAIDFELFKDKTEEAKTLATHIHNAGRQQFGWVRAERGEPVTLHNLYLGDVYGVWTNTAAFFKDRPEKDVQQIIQNQLFGFIKSHREPMMELITTILDANKKPKGLVEKIVSKRSQRAKAEKESKR